MAPDRVIPPCAQETVASVSEGLDELAKRVLQLEVSDVRQDAALAEQGTELALRSKVFGAKAQPQQGEDNDEDGAPTPLSHRKAARSSVSPSWLASVDDDFDALPLLISPCTSLSHSTRAPSPAYNAAEVALLV